MVDRKPLLQDRPPAYNAVPGAYEYATPTPRVSQAARVAPRPGFPYTPAGSLDQSPKCLNVAQVGVTRFPPPSVVVVGGCPACRVGVLEDDFTCLGILCAIFFFPLGLLFCFALRQRRCPNCGATFG
uniref:Membrane protein BRI3 n=1 Tax=Tetraodon nigroviridis TaxID=99883 RepID=H3BXI6_TETNG